MSFSIFQNIKVMLHNIHSSYFILGKYPFPAPLNQTFFSPNNKNLDITKEKVMDIGKQTTYQM